MIDRLNTFGRSTICRILGGIKCQPIGVATIWMLAAGAMLSACGVFVRLGARELHPFELAFFRNAFGLPLVLPWLIRHGVSSLKEHWQPLYALRAVSSLVSMLAFFYAVSVLPLLTVTAVDFTTPVFAMVGAMLFLRERPSRVRVMTGIGCLAGVLCITHPGAAMLNWNVVVILVSAIAGGVTIVTVKALSRTQPPGIIVAYFVLMQIPLSLVPALFVWRWPSPNVIPFIVSLGIFGTLAHACSTRAYELADTSVIATLEYSRLVYAGLIGFLLFGELPTRVSVLGAGIIAISASALLRHEIGVSRRMLIGVRPATVA